MENINLNLKDISTDELLKQAEIILEELKSRGYKVPSINNIKKISRNSKVSSTTNKQVILNIDCKKVFEEKSLQELITLLNNYSKSEINEFYNQISAGNDIKLSGSKEDYIQAVIGLKRAIDSAKAFQKW